MKITTNFLEMNYVIIIETMMALVIGVATNFDIALLFTGMAMIANTIYAVVALIGTVILAKYDKIEVIDPEES